MNFDEKLMAQKGHGDYTSLNTEDLPTFFLAYLTDPSDSGKIHSNVYERWSNGDAEVRSGMKKFAELTELAVASIRDKDWQKLGSLMDDNFENRRSLYGDAALGEKNLKMIEIARKHGAHAKFPGSNWRFHQNNEMF